MANLAGVKLEDGQNGFAGKYFPVRSIIRTAEEGSGAWLVSHRAEQRRRFKAMICPKPERTYSRLREERRRTERREKSMMDHGLLAEDEEEGEDQAVLDGFFLLKHCCVDDPADLCSVNVSSQGLAEVKEEDLELFDNVAYVNAGENLLPFEALRGFPILRELEMPLNGLRNLKLEQDYFPTLETLDLSFNNLSPGDVLTLGILPRLRVLHLTGNGLSTLPPDMANIHVTQDSAGNTRESYRFPRLEILFLDENQLAELEVFAALAGLRSLRHLSLEKNEVESVPQLKLVEGKHQAEASTPSSARRRRARSVSSRSARSSRRTKTPRSRQGTEVEDKPGEQPERMKEAGAGTDGGKAKDGEEDTVREETTDTARSEFYRGDTIPPGVVNVPPFPELTHLNLAHNNICEEEALLAVAAWPMLAELVIHDNPLTAQTSGEPPLLRRYLQDRLNITLIRKKPPALSRPHIEVSQKPGRRVRASIPPIPKRTLADIDKLLALEAPPQPPQSQQSDSRPSSQPNPAKAEEKQEERKPSPVSEAWISQEDSGEGDTFFMTQVADQGAPREKTDMTIPEVIEEDEEEGEEDGEKTRREKERRRRERQKARHHADSPAVKKYEGYEELFNLENDPEVDALIPKDIQGNVRALRHALNNGLLYRDANTALDKKQAAFRPLHRAPNPPTVPKPTRREKVKAVVTQLQNRSTLVEANLAEVIKDKRKFKKEFPDAEGLLAQVQHRYSRVRTASVSHARDVQQAQELLAAVNDDVQKLKQ